MDLQLMIAIAVLVLFSAFVGALMRDILFAWRARAWTERYFGFDDENDNLDEGIGFDTSTMPRVGTMRNSLAWRALKRRTQIGEPGPEYAPGTAVAIREPAPVALAAAPRSHRRTSHRKAPGYLRLLAETDALIARFDQGRTATS